MYLCQSEPCQIHLTYHAEQQRTCKWSRAVVPTRQVADDMAMIWKMGIQDERVVINLTPDD